MNDAANARHHICNLLYRYAEAVDDGDFATLREIFADAVIDAAGTAYHGADGVEKMFTAFTVFYNDEGKPAAVPDEPGRPGTSHIITNPIIDVAEDGLSARSRSRYSVFQKHADLPLQIIVQGRYEDQFECVDGRWRLSHRRYGMDATGDLSQHLVQLPPS